MATIKNPELPSHIRDVVSPVGGAAPDMRGKNFGPWARAFAKDPQPPGFGLGDDGGGLPVDSRPETERIQERYANAVERARTHNEGILTILRDYVRLNPGEKIGADFYSDESADQYKLDLRVLEATGAQKEGWWPLTGDREFIGDLLKGQYTESELRSLGLQDIFAPETLVVIQNGFFNNLVRMADWRNSDQVRLQQSSVPGLESGDQIPQAYNIWLNNWIANPRVSDWQSSGRWEFLYHRGLEFTAWLQAQTETIAPENNIFVGENISEVQVGALEARAIEPEAERVEKKADGAVILAETAEEKELEAAIRLDSPHLIKMRIPLENLLRRVSSVDITDPEARGAALLEVFKEEMKKQNYFTGHTTNLEFTLQRNLRSLMYSPRQINQILDMLGFSREQRARLEDEVYGGKQYDMDQHSKFPFTDPIWGMERKIWEKDEGYQGWVAAREQAERRRVPAAIERAFENGRLNTENLDGLIGFFDGISRASEAIAELTPDQREDLGDRIVDVIAQIYERPEPDLRRVRNLGNLIFLLSLENNFDAPTRAVFEAAGSTNPGPIVQSAGNAEVSQEAYQGIAGAFEGGRLDISSSYSIINFFEAVARAGEAVNALPVEKRNLLEDRIVDEMSESLDSDPARVKQLGNLAIFLGLDLTMSDEAKDVFDQARNYQAEEI